MPRRRKSLAILCVAIAALAAFVPGAVSGDVIAFLVPVWLEFQPEFVTVIRLDTTPCDEQPLSLLSTALSRAPPIRHSA